jgi:adenosylcobinamide kinase/adenosylcobinamide-phosphate guanylyltransferase
MITLITGGVKSGKSSYALKLAEEEFTERFLLATAVPFDGEMREKIRRHREERAGRFETVEEPVAIDKALRNDMIVDCIPVWLNNLFYNKIEDRAFEILDRFIAAFPKNLVIVTNETGMGNIPMDAATRAYNDLLGKVNQRLAAACGRVVLMVCGLPLTVKGPAPGGGSLQL